MIFDTKRIVETSFVKVVRILFLKRGDCQLGRIQMSKNITKKILHRESILRRVSELVLRSIKASVVIEPVLI